MRHPGVPQKGKWGPARWTQKWSWSWLGRPLIKPRYAILKLWSPSIAREPSQGQHELRYTLWPHLFGLPAEQNDECLLTSTLEKKARTALPQWTPLFFAEKWGPQRKDFGDRYGFPGFIGFLHLPPAWKVFLWGQKSSLKHFLSVVLVYAFAFGPEL